MSPSYHHAYLSSNLNAVLHRLKNYSVFSELTIQIEGKDYVPDVCLYPKKLINFSSGDIIKMTELPLLAIEVLSPTQGTQEVIDKFKIYFAAGIKSCWLIIPPARTIVVYSTEEKIKSFHRGLVVDENLSIRVSLKAIFEG